MSRVYKRDPRDRFWSIDFVDAQGKRQRKQLDVPNKRIAREILNGILGDVARRKHLGVITDSQISFADFAKEWWERISHTLGPRTQERWLGIVENHLIPAFAGALRSVTAASAEAYVARRIEQGAKASTINREMMVLKAVLRRAVEWGRLGRNPFRDMQGQPTIKPLKELDGRTRFLSLGEIDALVDACARRPQLEAFVIVAMNTGMRRNEILSLTRATVDWANKIANLATTKNGESRHVPLNAAALGALRSLPARLDGRLFDFGSGQVSAAVTRAAQRAGIEDFSLHDLRHTFASYQAMAGVQSRGLQSLLGHRDGRMTARYSHLSDAYLRTAVDAVTLGRSEAGIEPKDAVS
jgi:integrase